VLFVSLCESSVRNIRQAERLQVMPLALPHLGGARVRLVVVAAQVQQAVDDVQRQLDLDACPRSRAAAWATSAPMTSSPASFLRWARSGGSSHVRRLVVIQVALVERVDRRVIDERQADLGVRRALALQHRRATSRIRLRSISTRSCGLAMAIFPTAYSAAPSGPHRRLMTLQHPRRALLIEGDAGREHRRRIPSTSRARAA